MRRLISMLLLLPVLAGPGDARAASSEERLLAAQEVAADALVTVLHRDGDGVVLRTTGLWLEPGGDLLLVPLDVVRGDGALAVLPEAPREPVRARFVAGDVRRRLAVLQVMDLTAPSQVPRISKRYPKPDEVLPLLTSHGEPGSAKVSASAEQEIRIELGDEEPPAGALLLDAKGDAAAMVVPAVPGRDAHLVPLYHSAEVRSRSVIPQPASRKTPAQAVVTCQARAALGAPGGRGCVDPNRVELVVKEAADAAEAVVSAELGRPVDTLNRAGWTQVVLARLEGRAPIAAVDWVGEAEVVDVHPDGPRPALDFPEHETFFERGELRLDRRRPLESLQETQGYGVRASTVVMLDEETAWVLTAGVNADGSRWKISRHWHAFAGGWSLDVRPEDDALAGLPDGWPDAVDERPWLRDAVMKDMMAQLREQHAPEDEEDAE